MESSLGCAWIHSHVPLPRLLGPPSAWGLGYRLTGVSLPSRPYRDPASVWRKRGRRRSLSSQLPLFPHSPAPEPFVGPRLAVFGVRARGRNRSRFPARGRADRMWGGEVPPLPGTETDPMPGFLCRRGWFS